MVLGETCLKLHRKSKWEKKQNQIQHIWNNKKNDVNYFKGEVMKWMESLKWLYVLTWLVVLWPWLQQISWDTLRILGLQRSTQAVGLCEDVLQRPYRLWFLFPCVQQNFREAFRQLVQLLKIPWEVFRLWCQLSSCLVCRRNPRMWLVIGDSGCVLSTMPGITSGCVFSGVGCRWAGYQLFCVQLNFWDVFRLWCLQ